MKSLFLFGIAFFTLDSVHASTIHHTRCYILNQNYQAMRASFQVDTYQITDRRDPDTEASMQAQSRIHSVNGFRFPAWLSEEWSRGSQNSDFMFLQNLKSDLPAKFDLSRAYVATGIHVRTAIEQPYEFFELISAFNLGKKPRLSKAEYEKYLNDRNSPFDNLMRSDQELTQAYEAAMAAEGSIGFLETISEIDGIKRHSRTAIQCESLSANELYTP